MSEFQTEPEAVVEIGHIAMISHLLIRDKQTGEVLVNQRDRAPPRAPAISERNLSEDEHTTR